MPKKKETREQLLQEIQRLQENIEPDTTLSAEKLWAGSMVPGRRMEQLCDALWNVYAEDAKSSPYCMEDDDFVEMLIESQYRSDDTAILPIGEIKQALQDMLKLLQRSNATHVALNYGQPNELVRLIDTPVATLKRIRNDLTKAQQRIAEQEAIQAAIRQKDQQEEQLLELARTIGIEKAIQTLQEK